MKRILGIFVVLALGAGCSSEPNKPVPADSAPTAPSFTSTQSPTTAPLTAVNTPLGATDLSSPVVATVDGQPITRADLETILIKSHGLNSLLELVQLEAAKQIAKQANVTVTQADIDAEYDLSLKSLVPDSTPDEYAAIVQQVLSSQHLTRPDFDLWLETNAYLRKAAEPKAKEYMTDEHLHEAFNAMYGEQVQVRHIQFSHLSKAAEIKQRLAGGESFAQVAEDLSENERTRRLGGELIPFSRNDTNLPTAFKDAAFALKEGQISDIVEADGAYHIILLEKRIAPKVVKFEDEKDTLYKDLLAKATQARMQELRVQVAEQVKKTLQIDDQDLNQQYEAQIAAAQAKEQEQTKDDFQKDLMDKIHAAQKNSALHGASATPTPTDRPPATMSGGTAPSDTQSP